MSKLAELDVRPRTEPFALRGWDIPHPRPFLSDVRVMPHQISSTIAHVSNIEYVRWLDRAAELHANSLGYTRATLLDQGLMWFVARHEIDYLAECWPDDELVIATWVRSFSRVKSWRDYAILRPSDKSVVCRAATLWVLVELASRRPKRIPCEMVQRFMPMNEVSGVRCQVTGVRERALQHSSTPHTVT